MKNKKLILIITVLVATLASLLVSCNDETLYNPTEQQYRDFLNGKYWKYMGYREFYPDTSVWVPRPDVAVYQFTDSSQDIYDNNFGYVGAINIHWLTDLYNSFSTDTSSGDYLIKTINYLTQDSLILAVNQYPPMMTDTGAFYWRWDEYYIRIYP